MSTSGISELIEAKPAGQSRQDAVTTILEGPSSVGSVLPPNYSELLISFARLVIGTF